MDIVLIMLKESWKDNISLVIMMHGNILFDSDIPSLEKIRCSFIPGASQVGERFLHIPFSIMFK